MVVAMELSTFATGQSFSSTRMADVLFTVLLLTRWGAQPAEGFLTPITRRTERGLATFANIFLTGVT